MTDLTRSADDHTPTSVGVLVVLYDNSLSEIWQLVRSVGQTIRSAFADPVLAPNVVRISLGDCSDRPCLTEPDVRELRDAMSDRVTLDYKWFAENLGHSGGVNALAQDAPEDALLILNPDAYASPQLLVSLLRAMRDRQVGAVDARQIPCEHPKWYDPIVGDQSWASGACVLVRTSLFRAAGGFDAEFFPSYVNDVDLSWRLRLLGARVVHQPDAVVFHDKRLDQGAGVKPTRIELFEGILGRLMLATKFDRADIVADTITLVGRHGTSEQRRAVRVFEQRKAVNDIPRALADAAKVADFVGDEYGRRRY
ncbi:MAG: hypothetical protein ABW215_09845 [Kibdelosporangium sp.]